MGGTYGPVTDASSGSEPSPLQDFMDQAFEDAGCSGSVEVLEIMTVAITETDPNNPNEFPLSGWPFDGTWFSTCPALAGDGSFTWQPPVSPSEGISPSEGKASAGNSWPSEGG